MSTTVKHFHSAMSGAPTLNGVAGSLIAVLDACLADGFGLKTADSVVVSGGIATATFSTGHSFEPDVIALVAGATPAGLNGEKRVLTTSTNTITFDATDIADGTATGTITIKLAPAGWAKAFSGTNLAAYRALDPTGRRMFLRVDDTGTLDGRVVGYESMTDVNTGVGGFPLPTQISGGGFWPKANAANATARGWTLIADSRGFWLHTHTATSSIGANGCVWGFGDFASYKAGDPYGCALWCAPSTGGASTAANVHAVESVLSNTGVSACYAPRSFTGLGGAVEMRRMSESFFSSGVVSGAEGGSVVFASYPNPANNGLFMTRHLVFERSFSLRGATRGVLLAPQNCHAAFNWRDKIDGQGSMYGRKLIAVKCGAPANTTSQGVIFFDITGPWE